MPILCKKLRYFKFQRDAIISWHVFSPFYNKSWIQLYIWIFVKIFIKWFCFENCQKVQSEKNIYAKNGLILQNLSLLIYSKKIPKNIREWRKKKYLLSILILEKLTFERPVLIQMLVNIAITNSFYKNMQRLETCLMSNNILGGNRIKWRSHGSLKGLTIVILDWSALFPIQIRHK